MSALAVVQPEVPYAEGRMNFESLVKYLDSTEADQLTISALERTMEKKGRELMRQLLQDHIDARGPGKTTTAVHGADGTERSRIRLHERNLETVFGTLEIQRAGYGQEGTSSLHPLDAELNLPPELYSHELRRRAAEETAKGSFDEVALSIQRNTGGAVPKRQIEQLAARAAQDFDAFYQQRHLQAAQQETGSVLVLSADGKGVVMRTEDLREATRKAAGVRKHKLATRLSKGEKRNAKRMATVAAVYTIAPYVRQPENIIHAKISLLEAEPPRPKPENKRVWASLEKTPEQIIEKMFQEAEYRDPQRHKKWVALVDGNKPQIRILRQVADPRHRIRVGGRTSVSSRRDLGTRKLGPATAAGNPPGQRRPRGGGHASQRYAPWAYTCRAQTRGSVRQLLKDVCALSEVQPLSRARFSNRNRGY